MECDRTTLRFQGGSPVRIVVGTLVIVMSILIVPPVHAAPEIAHIRQIGSSEDDSAESVTVSGSSLYIAGETDGTLPDQSSSGGKDAFVRKHTTGGSHVWTRQFGTSSLDRAFGVATASGAIYVVGDTDGTLPDQSTAGGKDAFVRKYSPAGDVVWTRQFGTTGADQANGVAATGSGIYVAGSTTGTFPDESSAGTTDAFVRRYDASGNHVWTHQFGTPTADQAQGVVATGSGIYVSGSTTGALPDESSAGGFDAFLLKFDASGGIDWQDQFGSPAGDQALEVASNSTGIYVAGYMDGTLPGQSSLGGSDGFLVRYDASGSRLWTRQFGSSTTDQARGVAATSGGIYVSGPTFGAFPGQSSSGDNDVYVRKYEASGKPMWMIQFGTSEGDQAFGMTAAPSGIYITGNTEGAFPDQSNSGNDDAYVARLLSYRPDGLIRLAKTRGYAGNNIYNTRAKKQTKKAKARRNAGKTFLIQGQNDGDAKDGVKVKGCGPSPGFKVTYFSGITGKKNVTGAVRAGTFKLKKIVPGARKTLRMVIRATASADLGATKRCRVTIASTARPAIKDVVKAVARVVKG